MSDNPLMPWTDKEIYLDPAWGERIPAPDLIWLDIPTDSWAMKRAEEDASVRIVNQVVRNQNEGLTPGRHRRPGWLTRRVVR